MNILTPIHGQFMLLFSDSHRSIIRTIKASIIPIDQWVSGRNYPGRGLKCARYELALVLVMCNEGHLLCRTRSREHTLVQKKVRNVKRIVAWFKLFLLATWMSLPIQYFTKYQLQYSTIQICTLPYLTLPKWHLCCVWLGLSVSRLLVDHHWSRLTWWFPPKIHFFFAESIIGSITLGLVFWNNL